MISTYTPKLPLQIGIDGWKKTQSVQNISDISYQFKRRELVNLSGGSAIFISTSDFRVAHNNFCARSSLFNDKLTYGGQDYYILFVASHANRYSGSMEWCKIINLDAVESLAINPLQTSAVNLVRKHIPTVPDVTELPILKIGEIFPKIHGHRNIDTGEIIGFYPIQQLEEVVAISEYGVQDRSRMIGKLLQGSFNIWSQSTPEHLGDVVLELMNWNINGDISRTVPPLIEKVLRNYNNENGYYNFEKGAKLREEHGEAAIDMVLAILDDLDIIGCGSCPPGWLSNFGKFLVDNLKDAPDEE